jgi:prepilin-type N-terminal cleavage/methylation domain-containing protein
MKKNKKGFTLIELVVVTVIMGILASMGVPYYLKTVESSKASDAVAIGPMLATSYRMFKVDTSGATLNGTITDNCNGGACLTTDTTGCRLIRCNYVARQSWNASAYNFTVNAGVPIIVNVSRKNGGSPGTNTPGYSTWGYAFSDMSVVGIPGCAPTGGTGALPTPTCPNF